MRDRVVLWVLVGGLGAALLSWRFLGPWLGIVLVVLTVIAAAVVYRIEPPRIDLHGSPAWFDDADRVPAGDAEPDETDQ